MFFILSVTLFFISKELLKEKMSARASGERTSTLKGRAEDGKMTRGMLMT